MLTPATIIPFDGNHADIPDGFTRDTRFDGKFPKGASSSFGDTGGSNAHTHTATHTHTVATHTHTATASGRIDGSTYGMGTSGSRVNQDHFHAGPTSNNTTGDSGTETSGSTAASLASTSNLPSYYEVIFIKPTSFAAIPTNGMIYHTGTRVGMDYHTASENKFLRGAGTGANAGGTGGAASHAHTQSHTHTANAHSHATGLLRYDRGEGEDGGSSPDMAHEWHTHTFTVQNSTQNMNANTTNSSTTNHEMLHRTLKHYKATTNIYPTIGDIVITTETTNPSGWATCDGTKSTPDMVGYYVKNTQTANQTAGANTHSHTLSHSHTGSGTHTHTANNPTGYSGTVGGRHGSGKTGVANHRHNITGISSVTANYNTTVATSTTVNNEPEYILVKFIQMQSGPQVSPIMFF